MKTRNRLLVALCGGVLAFGLVACGDDDDDATGGGDDAAAGLSGDIQIDGSSTVAPLSELAAELFQEENPDVRIVVGTSGTGGGFEKFCVGETDISDASRQIEDDEVKSCGGEGIEFEEITVANDGLAVVVNPENPVECLTVAQLNSIWAEGSKLSSWSEVEGLDAEFGEDLEMFGPGTDSGTFDYFTEAINGEEGNQRTDYNNIGEDDNGTVRGVSGNPGGIGYFGLSFAEQNSDTLKLLQVDGGDGCVEPTTETVQDGTYQPLGRGLFIYPSASALEKPEVQAFIDFYIENAQSIAEQALFVPLTDDQKTEAIDKVASLVG